MVPRSFFTFPAVPGHCHYEALRAFYLGELSHEEAAAKFNFKPAYVKKLRVEFVKNLNNALDPFFSERKTGPKERFTSRLVIDRIIELRKHNYAITDIKVALDVDGQMLALDTIDKILKQEGFAPLPRRTRQQRCTMTLPHKIKAPQSLPLSIEEEQFTTEMSAGALIFMPLIEQLGIIDAIKQTGFPATKTLDDVQMILSFLALKLMGDQRWSYDTVWNMDRALGLFSGLNVLPKSTTLSTYSYRVTRQNNQKFLLQLAAIFKDDAHEQGEFNLDFKRIPHWGDDSVLEKNWSGTRSKTMKSILSLIVQDPDSGYISYTDAEIKHANQNDAVFDFIDFWKQGRGSTPEMLIFDSKFSTYKNLNQLNQSKEKIKFLSLRRRSKKLIARLNDIPEHEWQKVRVARAKGKQQMVRVYDGRTTLRHYEGEVREVILTEHGRIKPAFLITNDFDMNVRCVVEKYARRCLVEEEIAEQIMFFQLNHPASSIVVKVDFELVISVLADNLYRYLASHLSGFENCTAKTIQRKFLENGARINIENNEVSVHIKKKTHLPLLFEMPWMGQTTKLSWLGLRMKFIPATVC